MEKEIIIFTDGASKGNPGPGGWGAVIVFDGQVAELGGMEKETTNNRMEMKAVMEAFRFVKDKNDDVKIFTDSSYVLNGITKWVSGWKERNWKTLAKEDVLNKDLWEEFSYLADERKSKINWQLLKGHSGIVGNERVDEIASGFAEGKHVHLFFGQLKDYEKNILDIDIDEEKMSKKSLAKERSRAKAYSYVSQVGGVIEVFDTWAECEKKVKGKSGAKFKKSLSAEDERAIIEEWQGNH